MQRIKYAAIPGLEGKKHIQVAVQIYQKIKQDQCSDRELRRWLRTEGWYDKTTYEGLLEVLDIKTTPKALELGSFAKKVVEESNPETRQDLFFSRLAGFNEILIKYVFDHIQERLYSTNELFRMLTSYVYPGKLIDLPDFNAWLKWIEATERIRVLGIRWALGPTHPKSQGYISTIDVDEILEEEAEEELMDLAGEEEEEAPAPPPAPAREDDDEESMPPGAWEPPEDDEEADDGMGGGFGGGGEVGMDLPAMGGAPLGGGGGGGGGVDAAALAQALAAIRPADPTRIEARLLKPAPHLSALAAGAPMELIKEAMDRSAPEAPEAWLESLTAGAEVQAENVRAVLEWYKGVDERPLIRADQYGIMPFGEGGWMDGSRAEFMFRLACLAVSVLRTPAPGGEVTFAVLDGAGFFRKLFAHPDSVERLMDELFEQGLGGRPELFANLHLTLMLARALRGSEAWCAKLEDRTAEEVYTDLWQRLAGYNLDLEVLWIVRELSMFGLLRQDALRDSRVVPTEEARRMAFHLGLVETTRAPSLPAMLHLSRRLTPLLGNALEGPLVAMWRVYGARPPQRFWSR